MKNHAKNSKVSNFAENEMRDELLFIYESRQEIIESSCVLCGVYMDKVYYGYCRWVKMNVTMCLLELTRQ